MAVRRTRYGVTISGDDLKDLKAALRRSIVGPEAAKVPPGHALCPVCKKALPIRTREQVLSGICDPCWDLTLPSPEKAPEGPLQAAATAVTKDDDEHMPF